MLIFSLAIAVNEHNILFDFENVFERTLGTEPKTTWSEVGVQVDLLPKSSTDFKKSTQNLKRKRSASRESSGPDQNDNTR